MVVVLALTSTAFADGRVIPPGQEALLSEMLGMGEVLSGGCRLDRAAIDRDVVHVRYRCGAAGQREVRLLLVHPSAAGDGAVTTGEFAIRVEPPAADASALVAAVAARMRSREAHWRWANVEPALFPPLEPDTPASLSAAARAVGIPGVDQTYLADLARAGRLVDENRREEAIVILTSLARRAPRYPGVLGALVSNLAASAPVRSKVDARVLQADAAPADPLLQFVAGVSAHYCGHNFGGSPAEKRALYEIALRYLGRTLPAYDFEPRVFIYLAVSHYRLGHQAEAERLIDQAFARGPADPDTYYCRAEIYHRKDLGRSIADLERYLALSAEHLAKGHRISPSKQARVRRMYEALVARRAQGGDDSGGEPFDPINRLDAFIVSPRAFGKLLGGLGALVAVFALAAWRLRRRRAKALATG